MLKGTARFLAAPFPSLGLGQLEVAGAPGSAGLPGPREKRLCCPVRSCIPATPDRLFPRRPCSGCAYRLRQTGHPRKVAHRHSPPPHAADYATRHSPPPHAANFDTRHSLPPNLFASPVRATPSFRRPSQGNSEREESRFPELPAALAVAAAPRIRAAAAPPSA